MDSGLDAAFNYKEGKIEDNLRKHCPNGIDIYFDAIAGEMLDAVLAIANPFSRIIGCSTASTEYLYKNLGNIVLNSIKYEGYVVFNHMDFEEQFLREATPLLASGAAKYRMDIVNGIEHVPEELVKSFYGNKNGKQVVHVADL